jgi:hypothetical protein
MIEEAGFILAAQRDRETKKSSVFILISPQRGGKIA